MNPPEYTSLPTRFWDKVEVDPKTGCWVWTGGSIALGYGVLMRHGTSRLAHRLSAADFYGPIPDGLCALHHCDNPPCVWPKHLYIGTRQDNMDDRMKRGKNNPAKGARNAGAKLTEQAVLSIRHDYNNNIYQRRLYIDKRRH